MDDHASLRKAYDEWLHHASYGNTQQEFLLIQAVPELMAENERLRRVVDEADKLMRSHAPLTAELPLRVALEALTSSARVTGER